MLHDKKAILFCPWGLGDFFTTCIVAKMYDLEVAGANPECKNIANLLGVRFHSINKSLNGAFEFNVNQIGENNMIVFWPGLSYRWSLYCLFCKVAKTSVKPNTSKYEVLVKKLEELGFSRSKVKRAYHHQRQNKKEILFLPMCDERLWSKNLCVIEAFLKEVGESLGFKVRTAMHTSEVNKYHKVSGLEDNLLTFKNVKELQELVIEYAAVVASDSFAGHVAQYFNPNTLVVYGPTEGVLNSVDKEKYLQSSVECSPCYGTKNSRHCPIGQICFSNSAILATIKLRLEEWV